MRARALALSTVALFGCISDGGDEDCEDGKCDGNGGLFNTFNGNVADVCP